MFNSARCFISRVPDLRAHCETGDGTRETDARIRLLAACSYRCGTDSPTVREQRERESRESEQERESRERSHLELTNQQQLQ
jgi:hypothetical protein